MASNKTDLTPQQQRKLARQLKEVVEHERSTGKSLRDAILVALATLDKSYDLTSLQSRILQLLRDAHTEAMSIGVQHATGDVRALLPPSDDHHGLFVAASAAALAGHVARTVAIQRLSGKLIPSPLASVTSSKAAIEKTAVQVVYHGHAAGVAEGIKRPSEQFPGTSESLGDFGKATVPSKKPKPTTSKVLRWCAVLDKRTCPRCRALDGQTRPFDRPFGQPPPLHPLCRCFIHVVEG